MKAEMLAIKRRRSHKYTKWQGTKDWKKYIVKK